MEAANLVEQVHLATLLHDDVVDQAEIRRGQKAARVVFGEAASILAGDYLYTSVFERLKQFEDPRVQWLLAEATRQMAEGELLQLSQTINWESQLNNEQQYKKIALYKTAVLIGAAAAIGGILGSANVEQIEHLKQYGNQLGIAFQIIDDALDYDEQKNTGKQIGLDFKGRKVTLPFIFLVFSADAKDFQCIQRVWSSAGTEGKQIQAVLELMKKYQSLDKAKTAAANHAKLAL